MKKIYKLIKKYPKSPVLGTKIEVIINSTGSWNVHSDFVAKDTFFKDYAIPSHLENYPEFWQEIKPKEWEILSFRDNYNYIYPVMNGRVGPFSNNCSVENALNENYPAKYTIYSVKRLSDGEVFTIGEKIQYNDFFQVITSFKLNSVYVDDITACYSNNYRTCPLSLLKKYIERQPLFTTEDGVEIFKDDWYYTVDTSNHQEFKLMGPHQATGERYGLEHQLKTFKSKSRAVDNYIMNKPCLTIMEVFYILNTIRGDHMYALEQLVKSK